MFAVVAAGLATALLVGVSYYSAHLFTSRYTPWVVAALQIEADAVSGHLKLAEDHPGVVDGRYEAALDDLERALVRVRVLLDGASEGALAVAPLNQAALRARAEEIDRLLGLLRGLVEGLRGSRTGGDSEEVRFHQVFTELVLQTDALHGVLEAKMARERGRFHQVQMLLLLAVLAATLTAAWMVRRQQHAWRRQAGRLDKARQQAEASEEHYRRVAEDIPLLICRYGQDGRITFANRACGEAHGVPPAVLEGTRFQDLFDPEDRQEVMAGIAGLTPQAPTRAGEHRVVDASGDERWQRWTDRALFDADGRLVGCQSFGQDITEGRRTREKERFRLAFQRVATDVSSRLLASRDEEFDAVADAALEQLGTLFDVDRAYLFLFSDDRLTMDNTHEWCAPGIEPQRERNQSLRCREFPYVVGGINRLETVQIEDVKALSRDEAPERDELRRQGICSLIALPVAGPHRALWGLLGFDVVRRHFVWSDEQVRMLRILADIFGAAVSRRRAEAELRESSDRYRAVLESVQDGYLVTDPQGRLVEVNDAYCRMSGYSRPELLALAIPDLEAQETPEETARHLQEIAAGGSAIFESRHRRKDGVTWPVEVSVSYADVEGGRYFSFVRDIHQRRLAQHLAELRQALSEAAQQEDARALMRRALDAAEAMTGSEIAFFHYVEPDQQTLSLQVWSTRTLRKLCAAEGEGLHYPVSEAGVWADCIYQGAPVIHNDYAGLPHRKGLPEGHAPVVRLATVPVFRDGLITAAMGVGNKASHYTQQDVEVVNRVADMVFDFVERKRAQQHVEYMAYHDALTGVPNRDLLFDRLNQALAHCRRSGGLLAVCYLDLDDFKPVNDTYGHNVGDALLVEVSQRLGEALRDGDTLARLGGDEFIVLLTELATAQQSEAIVERILSGLAEPFHVHGQEIRVSGSMGITLFPGDDADADGLVRHADQAMYQAKAIGPGSHRLYDTVQDQELRMRRETLAEVDRALERDEFVLHYQPRVDLRNGDVVGVEALVRWQHPGRGLLAPGQFLYLLEDTPQEMALGAWVVRTALDQHGRWREQGLVMPVSVNISPKHLQQPGFAELFLAPLLEEYPPGFADNLELEVLETAGVGDIAHVAGVMKACTELGVRFSLDDFGTGYSSLTYFHRLPIDILKIDQNFVRNMVDQVGDLDIVEGVLRLAEALDRPVVAEGVETIELGLLLLYMGCHYAQGYGIARPMPADALVPWLDTWGGQSVWHHLDQEVEASGLDIELQVAIFSHRSWIDDLADYVNGEPGAVLPPLEEGRCQFGRWYNGIGRARYGRRPGYAFLPPRHTRVHEWAESLFDLLESGRRDEARAGLAELRARGRELTTLLEALAGQ